MQGIFHRGGAYLIGAEGHRRVFHWDPTPLLIISKAISLVLPRDLFYHKLYGN
jgi:hypothetical protein